MNDALLKIPFPPGSFMKLSALNRFEPAPELNDLLENSVLNEHHRLFNEEHIHLLNARIGFLWTSAPNVKQMKRIVGTAEMPMFRGNAWQKARQEMQVLDWFGGQVDFIITFDAGFRAECSELEFLAVFEQELYHCTQAVDMFGMPKFSRQTGKPIFSMRGHDVEEFTGVVRRYGIQATGQDRVDFVQAALLEPMIGAAEIKQLCGTCAG